MAAIRAFAFPAGEPGNGRGSMRSGLAVDFENKAEEAGFCSPSPSAFRLPNRVNGGRAMN